MAYAEEIEIQVMYDYLCGSRSTTQQDIADKYNYDSRFNSKTKISNLINAHFYTGVAGGGAKTHPIREALRGMEYEEFKDNVLSFSGQTMDDFEEHIKRRSGSNSSSSDYQSSDNISHRNKPASNKNDTSGKGTDSFGVVLVIAAIIGIIIFFSSCSSCKSCLSCVSCSGLTSCFSCNSSGDSERYIEATKNFRPATWPDNLTIGEVFDGICPDGSWTTFEKTDTDGLFDKKETWVRFRGNSGSGALNAEILLEGSNSISYIFTIDGKQAYFDDLYKMLDDPYYFRDKAAAEAEAKEAAEAEAAAAATAEADAAAEAAAAEAARNDDARNSAGGDDAGLAYKEAAIDARADLSEYHVDSWDYTGSSWEDQLMADMKINGAVFFLPYNDFDGMLLIDFFDGVCRDGLGLIEGMYDTETYPPDLYPGGPGEVQTNTYIPPRAIFTGQTDLGIIQAVIIPDENYEAISGRWWLRGCEIEASDLYREFFPG